MAWHRAGTMMAVHRQGFGPGSSSGLPRRRLLEAVPPGGNSDRVAVEGLEQERHDELRQNPRLGGPGIFVRQAAEPEDLLVALEGEFDLPPEAIERQHAWGVQALGGQGGE